MGLRDRIRRLERGHEYERCTLICPEYGERFVVCGREPYAPTVNFLLFLWNKGYQGGPGREPP